MSEEKWSDWYFPSKRRSNPSESEGKDARFFTGIPKKQWDLWLKFAEEQGFNPVDFAVEVLQDVMLLRQSRCPKYEMLDAGPRKVIAKQIILTQVVFTHQEVEIMDAWRKELGLTRPAFVRAAIRAVFAGSRLIGAEERELANHTLVLLEKLLFQMPELTPTDAERDVKELIKEIRTAILGPLLNLDFRRIKNGKN